MASNWRLGYLHLAKEAKKYFGFFRTPSHGNCQSSEAQKIVNHWYYKLKYALSKKEMAEEYVRKAFEEIENSFDNYEPALRSEVRYIYESLYFLHGAINAWCY